MHSQCQNVIFCYQVEYYFKVGPYVHVSLRDLIFIVICHWLFGHLFWLWQEFAASATPQNNNIFTFIWIQIWISSIVVLFFTKPHLTKLSPFFCNIYFSHAWRNRCWFLPLFLLSLNDICFMRLKLRLCLWVILCLFWAIFSLLTTVILCFLWFFFMCFGSLY